MPDTSDFTSAENFGASDPTTSTASVRSAATTGATVTATGGRPASAAGAGGGSALFFPHAAIATIAAPRTTKPMVRARQCHDVSTPCVLAIDHIRAVRSSAAGALIFGDIRLTAAPATSTMTLVSDYSH